MGDPIARLLSSERLPFFNGKTAILPLASDGTYLAPGVRRPNPAAEDSAVGEIVNSRSGEAHAYADEHQQDYGS